MTVDDVGLTVKNEDTNYIFIVGLDEIETSVLEVMTLCGDFVV